MKKTIGNFEIRATGLHNGGFEIRDKYGHLIEFRANDLDDLEHAVRELKKEAFSLLSSEDKHKVQVQPVR